MATDLTMPRLREGQQFQLPVDSIAIAREFIFDTARGVEYDLGLHTNPETSRPDQQLLVLAKDLLVVEDAYSSEVGWSIVAFRQDNMFIHFDQRLSAGQSEYAFQDVTNICWPEPTSRSLTWAVRAIAAEDKRQLARLTWGDCCFLSDLELGKAIKSAIEFMSMMGVTDPVAGLKERGFL